MSKHEMLRELMTQWGFTSHFEGCVDHMYLDTCGNVTIGVGFMLPDAQSALDLLWSAYGLPGVNYTNAWHSVHDAEKGHTASFYARYSPAFMTRAQMRAEFDRRAQALASQVAAEYGDALTFDGPRIALVDIRYNVGAHKMDTEFPRLKEACKAHDWLTAAGECHRVGVSTARNAATRALFLRAAGGENT